MRRTHLLQVASFLLVASSGAHAYGFAEDVCYFYDGDPETAGQVFYYPLNCYDLTCIDSAQADPATCAGLGFAQYLGVTMAGTRHGHSTVHFDVAFLAARLAGMTHQDALDTARYTENLDLGTYDSYTKASGRGLARANLQSTGHNTHGLKRTNDATLGFWLHYVPWFRAAGSNQSSSEVSPATYDADYWVQGATSPWPSTERPLTHVRRWAFEQNRQLCRLGLDEAGACLDGDVYISVPMISGVAISTGVADLRWQDIEENHGKPEGTDYSETRGPELAGSPEALGAYLHVLADRISHRACLDTSFVEPNTNPGIATDYSAEFANTCGTLFHAFSHYQETGHAEQTPARTGESVELLLRETLDWGRTRNISPLPAVSGSGYPMPGSANFFSDLTEDLVQALGEPCAADRMAALCRIARDGYGILWHDGNSACSYNKLPGDSTCSQ